MGGVSDELTVRVLSCTFGAHLPGLAHGHASWCILGPRYLARELPGTVTVGPPPPGLPVYAQEDVDPALVAEIADGARAARARLLAAGASPAVADHALPELMFAELYVTATLEQLLRHLGGFAAHSPALRTVDRGLACTLADTAPELYRLLPEGVFAPPCRQEDARTVD